MDWRGKRIFLSLFVQYVDLRYDCWAPVADGYADGHKLPWSDTEKRRNDRFSVVSGPGIFLPLFFSPRVLGERKGTIFDSLEWIKRDSSESRLEVFASGGHV